jgi:hypothetical protein
MRTRAEEIACSWVDVLRIVETRDGLFNRLFDNIANAM